MRNLAKRPGNWWPRRIVGFPVPTVTCANGRPVHARFDDWSDHADADGRSDDDVDRVDHVGHSNHIDHVGHRDHVDDSDATGTVGAADVDNATRIDDEIDGETTFTTYRNDEYGYRLRHPADWIVEAELPSEASFGARTGSAGVVVYVDEGVACTLAEYVADFLGDLRADEYLWLVDPVNRRDVALDSGQIGRVIECGYLSDVLGEYWRLAYLFVLVDRTGYIVGVDWDGGDWLEAVAAQTLESFTLERG